MGKRTIMNEASRANVWKLTAIGLAVAAVTAIVTGLVVANRMAPPPEARVEAPAAAPTATVTPPPSVAQTPTPAPSPTAPPAATEAPRPGVPPRDVIAACNRQAADEAGSAPRQGKDKALDIGKDAGIGAIGGAAVGAVGGAIADGGKGAGKGALIGGLVGAGGGTLYGIWDNKKNDERFREAYGACMRSRGYTG